MIIGLVNALLILAGFVMAILALVFMRRHGRDGVIQRAILGLVINTVLVSTIGYFALSMIRVGRKLAAAPRTNSTAVTGGKASRGDPAVLSDAEMTTVLEKFKTYGQQALKPELN